MAGQAEGAAQPGGVSALELAELAPIAGKIVRLLLRQGALCRHEIGAALGGPAGLDDDALDAEIDALIAQEWLSATGEGDGCVYRVCLRRKSGGRCDIWSALNL